jgi:hypothetical protein
LQLLWVLADIVWGGGYCIWKRVRTHAGAVACVWPHVAHPPQIPSEPRKILEARKRFMEESFGAGRKAEAEVQRLLIELMKVIQMRG